MGKKPIVVPDTNILVSAFGWNGPERRVYSIARQGNIRLVLSPPLMQELERVLCYPKFALSNTEIHAIMRDVGTISSTVDPPRSLDVIRDDPADNRVLECAIAAEADWIISGDRHLLELGSYEGILIVTARQLLERLARPS